MIINVAHNLYSLSKNECHCNIVAQTRNVMTESRMKYSFDFIFDKKEFVGALIVLGLVI